jgi:hypothetical protein
MADRIEEDRFVLADPPELIVPIGCLRHVGRVIGRRTVFLYAEGERDVIDRQHFTRTESDSRAGL